MVMISRYSLLLILAAAASIFAIRPNPQISRYKPIYASFSGSPSALVNGKFGETAWNVQDSSWIALKLEIGPKAVFFTWNATNYIWSDSIAQPGTCAKGEPVPVNYRVLISGNSTNGDDGTWSVVDSVFGNTVAARGHKIAFEGSFWVKMMVLSGGGKIDEIEVFDISNGYDDTWFFLGTDITADMFKKPVQMKHFGKYVMEYIKEFNPTATPAIIRGGVGCATMAAIVSDIDKYMKIAGNVGYFAIEVGTNDAWGGTTDNLKSFTDNLQKLITTCKANKIHPIIARTMATNPAIAGWQINEGYLAAIDQLTKKNGLVPGPDLYGWFSAHPEDLMEDGIRPSPRGSATIHRLWAEAVYKLYDESEKQSK